MILIQNHIINQIPYHTDGSLKVDVCKHVLCSKPCQEMALLEILKNYFTKIGQEHIKQMIENKKRK